MSATEDAVDVAARFVGPFLGKGNRPPNESVDHRDIVEEALIHLHAINAAEQTAAPDAPYDGSLVGVIYGLLDLITSFGILPYLSYGVAFGQRPQSVLVTSVAASSNSAPDFLSAVVRKLLPVLEQDGSGVQPLLSQRILPDVISALAELSFSPRTGEQSHETYRSKYEKLVASTPTSRLLPILTSLLQQDVPSWWKPLLSKELSMVPLRPHGVRHTIEFLSLSYLSQNSKVPQDASSLKSNMPLPLDAITQASRLLASVPSGWNQDTWFTRIAPELFHLLDGSEGKELSRAAGQIIAGGILAKKSTGAPKTIGWELFAAPFLAAISPPMSTAADIRKNMLGEVIVTEQELNLALKRLGTLASSYSHAGLLKRLLGPVVLSLWGLITYSSTHRSLNREWIELPRAIMLRYMNIACEPPRISAILSNIFYDGEVTWTFSPGSEGGIEIRKRAQANDREMGMGGVLERITKVDQYVSILVTLLAEADLDDLISGSIFVQTSRKWLSPTRPATQSLTNDPDVDPILALVEVKFSEALATQFKDKFARSPQHIIELMRQIIQNFVDEHQTQEKDLTSMKNPSMKNLGRLVHTTRPSVNEATETGSDDLASFALSITNTLLTSKDFKRNPEITMVLDSMLTPLKYLSQNAHEIPISSVVINAAANLIRSIQPAFIPTASIDTQAQHRETLNSAIIDLTSPEPPNRSWAISILRKLVRNSAAFPIIDVPSTAYMILSSSIADPESYVYTAAIPLLVDLAVRAPNPTIRIIVDAFVDIEEQSLRLKKEKDIEEALDFRLRVGEVLNQIVLEDSFWVSSTVLTSKYTSLKLIMESALSLASRRGHRKQTLAKRNETTEAERRQQEEGEAAWGGPIPNLLDPNADNPVEQAERDALFKIIQGWEDTGIEEDVRIRASALSVLSSVMEKRLSLLSKVSVDAILQMILLILTMESTEAKGILRRAAVLVVMGMLRAMVAEIEAGRESAAGLGPEKTEEIKKVMEWLKDDDVDVLVRGHAGSVIEGLEALQMQRLYKIRDAGLRLGPNMGLEENLLGLNIQPVSQHQGKKRLVVEEIE